MTEGWEHKPGSITFEGRLLLLQRLLYAEKQSGHKLITDEQLQAVLDRWTADGFEFKKEDIQPQNRSYDGSLILHPDGRLNERDTTLKAQVFDLWEDFNMSQEEVLSFLKERYRKTGKSIHYFLASWETEDLQVNSVQFVIAESNITNRSEARAFLDNWLGYNN